MMSSPHLCVGRVFFIFAPVMMNSNLGSVQLLVLSIFLLCGVLSLWLVSTSFFFPSQSKIVSAVLIMIFYRLRVEEAQFNC